MAGIERSFEKFARKPARFRKINGLAYCSQEVLRIAEELRTAANQGGAAGTAEREAERAFQQQEILGYFSRNQAALEAAAERASLAGQDVLAGDLRSAAAALGNLAAAESALAAEDFENLERRLTALEERIGAALMRATSAEQLARFREEVDQGLRIDRRRMSAMQIESLERQYLKRKSFEQYGVPRLSLFYL